jgi:hypothetical protein
MITTDTPRFRREQMNVGLLLELIRSKGLDQHSSLITEKRNLLNLDPRLCGFVLNKRAPSLERGCPSRRVPDGSSVLRLGQPRSNGGVCLSIMDSSVAFHGWTLVPPPEQIKRRRSRGLP